MAPSSRILSLHVFVLLLSALGPGARAAAVYGVNLGGWLVAEPWMTPSLFDPSKSDCEWTLCTNLGKDKCRDTLENHWKTFITRDDVEQIKNAGLTSIRIPLGYWAVIDLLPFEPYVSGQYQYLKQAVGWAKDLGLKVFIDLHGAPGSQNGWEESGYVGKQLFSANQSNADRTLQVIKNLTKEFSQSEYGGTVTNIEVLNEPTLDFAPLQKFYTQAAGVNATGINITLSDGFFQPHSWKNYDPWNAAATKPAPLLTLDTHQFWAFPPLDNLSEAQILTQVCELGMQLKVPNSGLMPTLIGEWSLSTGVTANSTSNTEQDQKKRTWFRRLFEAQHAAFSPNGEDQASVGWYFWSWKTEYDIDAWSYRKGLADGYIPSNISDPTKLIFPIKPNGCIDDTFAYTAAATVTPSPTPSGTTSDSSSASPSSSSRSTATKNDMIPVLLLSVQLLAGCAGFLYMYV